MMAASMQFNLFSFFYWDHKKLIFKDCKSVLVVIGFTNSASVSIYVWDVGWENVWSHDFVFLPYRNNACKWKENFSREIPVS